MKDLNGVKEETIYDDNRNIILRLFNKWDPELNDWVNYRKYKYRYDESGNQTLDSRYEWAFGTNDWLLNQRPFYYYSLEQEVFDQIFDTDIILYPNPTSGIINIIGLSEPAEVKLYTTQGQLMKSITQAANFIDISDLKPGIYILNLQVGYQAFAFRVMKQ